MTLTAFPLEHVMVQYLITCLRFSNIHYNLSSARRDARALLGWTTWQYIKRNCRNCFPVITAACPFPCTQTDEPWHSCLPHRPAWSSNAFTRGDVLTILQATGKKKENNATTKQLLPKGLLLVQLYHSCSEGRGSHAPLKYTQENPGFSVLDMCFLFTAHITPET